MQDADKAFGPEQLVALIRQEYESLTGKKPVERDDLVGKTVPADYEAPQATYLLALQAPGQKGLLVIAFQDVSSKQVGIKTDPVLWGYLGNKDGETIAKDVLKDRLKAAGLLKQG
jgi:hypothetical protein